MKSTPYQLRAFYLPGHAKNPIEGQEPKVFVGQQKVGGFVFTEGAMSLNLERYKAERQAKYLFRFHGVNSEVLQDVDVPTRSRTFSPKSEFAGVLGLVDENAGQSAEGQSPAGTGDADASNPGSPASPAPAGAGRQHGTRRGSSVAAKTEVDAATRQRLLGNGPSADTVKSDDGADGLT